MVKSKKTEEQSSLTSSLLAPSSASAEKKRSISSDRPRRSSASSADRGKNKPDIYQTYANNQPKIMLETINARTITIVFIVTYMIGFLSFGFDLQNTIAGFEDGNRGLSPDSCSSQQINPNYPPDEDYSYGCTFDSPGETIWMGHATGFNNIISFSLKLNIENITGFYQNDTLVVDDDIIQDSFVSYNVKLYCCFTNTKCGTILANGSRSDSSEWRLVIDTNGDVDFSTYQVGNQNFETNILENTFQNQETLPDQGIIRSYMMYVTYDPMNTVDGYIAGEYKYTFKNTNVQAYQAARVLLNILFFVSVVVAILYYRALKITYKDLRAFALPEQRWQIFYMLAVILFQNPFYCVIMWIEDPPVSVTYMTYIIDAVAQASFLTVWLLFSDGLRRNFDYWMFYVPKVLMGVFIALTSCIIVTLQFPSINKYDHRSPVLAVEEWSYDLNITLVSFSFIFLFCFCFWTGWWFYSLWHTGSQLQKLPYMSTRYLQLWFRFFTIQSILSSLYLISQYGAVIYFIFSNSAPSANSSIENVADNINTLFRQQTLAFGKVLFISVNSFVLAFFLLPAGYFDKSESSVTNLATTYVVNESEIAPIYNARKKAIRRLKLMNELFMDNPKAHVFCIDLAAELLELSWEAYNDVPGYPTISGYGFIDFDRVNYKLVNHAYDEQHDTVCYIVRHKVLPRVVICFRGTSSKQHWADNWNYTQRPIDFDELRIPDLDRVDGLGSSTKDIYANLRESDDSVFSNFTKSEKSSVENEKNSKDEVDITFQFPESPNDSTEFRENSFYSNFSSSSDGSNEENWVTDDDTSWDDEGDIDGRRPSSTMSRTMTGIFDRAGKTYNATTDILHSAVKNAPILNTRYDTFVHTGFWDAYLTVRDFIHTTLRQELAQRPAHVMCTGHSLGGALATLACLDIARHTLPRVNEHLFRLREEKRKAAQEAAKNANTNWTDATIKEKDLSIMKQKYIKCTLYTFGSPRIGNNGFANFLNSKIPDNFRVTVDGDVVTAVPKGGIFKNQYKHAGTEVVIDAIGSGSIIIDPSFIERRLRTHNKTSVSAHSLSSYRKGINGLKAAAEFMKSFEGTQEEEELGGLPDSRATDPAFVRRQVIIAKASAKAAQLSIAQMALLQAEQDEDLKRQDEDYASVSTSLPEITNKTSTSTINSHILNLESSGSGSLTGSDTYKVRTSSEEKEGDDSLTPQRMASTATVVTTPFRPVSFSTIDHSVSMRDKVASQGRDMDALVQSMTARSSAMSFMGTDFGSSFVKVLADLTKLRKNPEEEGDDGNLETVSARQDDSGGDGGGRGTSLYSGKRYTSATLSTNEIPLSEREDKKKKKDKKNKNKSKTTEQTNDSEFLSQPRSSASLATGSTDRRTLGETIVTVDL